MTEPKAAQELRVYRDDDRRKAHSNGTDTHGKLDAPAEKNTGGHGNSDDVVGRGPKEILNHLAVGCPREFDGSHHIARVAAHEHDSRRLRGADHPFLWKPKLRIPDIYESRENQLAFAKFLDTCACCNAEKQVLAAIRRLDQHRIKGLGPAAANLLYFLHPTIVPPFNTAIVKGYNLLTGATVKLGNWEEYLAMRDGILRLNNDYHALLSNDLGAAGGLLFDMGTGHHAPPPLEGGTERRATWERDLAKVRELSAKEHREVEAARESDCTHTEVQGWLRDLDKALGFDVWVAANDRARRLGAGTLGDGCLTALPSPVGRAEGAETVRLIDVLWLIPATSTVAAAFEIEHTTSIYSGILRLLDLAMGVETAKDLRMFLVAPDSREQDVRDQLLRAAFRNASQLNLKFLAYGALQDHRESIARFGTGIKGIEAIARTIP